MPLKRIFICFLLSLSYSAYSVAEGLNKINLNLLKNAQVNIQDLDNLQKTILGKVTQVNKDTSGAVSLEVSYQLSNGSLRSRLVHVNEEFKTLNPELFETNKSGDELAVDKALSFSKTDSVSSLAKPKQEKKQFTTSAVAAQIQLDNLAQKDRSSVEMFSSRQVEKKARSLEIYDEESIKAIRYLPIGSQKKAIDLFSKLVSADLFDSKKLYKTFLFNPRDNMLTEDDFDNANKFTKAIKELEIDGSKLLLSERRLLNYFLSRAPLYARQSFSEVSDMPLQSEEAKVPPLYIFNKIKQIASRGDDIVGEAPVQLEQVKPDDFIVLKNFDGKVNYRAIVVNYNHNGTVLAEDAHAAKGNSNKKFVLSRQTVKDSKLYRAVTAEIKINGELDVQSRHDGAEAYLNRTLSVQQKEALNTAWAIGGADHGYFDYTAKELHDKSQILCKSGFTVEEAFLLIQKGLVGQAPLNMIMLESDKVSNDIVTQIKTTTNVSQSRTIANVDKVNLETKINNSITVKPLNENEALIKISDDEIYLGKPVASVLDKIGSEKYIVIEYIDKYDKSNLLYANRNELETFNTKVKLTEFKAAKIKHDKYKTIPDNDIINSLVNGYKAAKEALGKGRLVTRLDLSDESQMALIELARRTHTTASVVFDAYHRGGEKAIQSLLNSSTAMLSNKNIGGHREISSEDVGLKVAKSKEQISSLSDDDYIINAGVGDAVSVNLTSDIGVIASIGVENNATTYYVSVKDKKNVNSIIKLTKKELASFNKSLTYYFDNKDNVFIASSPSSFVKSSDDKEFIQLIADISKLENDESHQVELKPSVKSLNELALAFATSVESTSYSKSSNREIKKSINNLQDNLNERKQLSMRLNKYIDLIEQSIGSATILNATRSSKPGHLKWELKILSPKSFDFVSVFYLAPVNFTRADLISHLKELIFNHRIELLKFKYSLHADSKVLFDLREQYKIPKPQKPIGGDGLFLKYSKIQSLRDLVLDLESVFSVRSEKLGVFDIVSFNQNKLLVSKMSEQFNYLDDLKRFDRNLQPETLFKATYDKADKLSKSGDDDLAKLYFQLCSDIVFESLQASAKLFWSDESNAVKAFNAAQVSDDQSIAELALNKIIQSKSKSTKDEELKKVSRDYFYNLNYEYNRIYKGIKNYSNKNKELELWFIRRRQNLLFKLYDLKNEIKLGNKSDSTLNSLELSNSSFDDFKTIMHKDVINQK